MAKTNGRKDKLLERYGLLDYQTKGKSQAEIAAGYAAMAANGGPQVDQKWFDQQHGGGQNIEGMTQQIQQQRQQSQQPMQAAVNLPIQNQPQPAPIQYATAENGLAIKVKSPASASSTPWEKLLNEDLTPNADNPYDPNFIQGPKTEDALAGTVNWTDVSVAERKGILTDPNFYKNNEITKYPTWMQQQILADPAFRWDQLPAWQRGYYELSSRPAGMGAVQGGLMGSLGGPVSGAVGTAIGATLGAAAGWSGYDQTKEFWQQGDGKWTWDKQQVKDQVNAGFGLANVLAEHAEKLIGFAAQVTNAAVDPNKNVADLLKNPEATYNAGASFFEVIAPAFQAAVKGDGVSPDDALKIIPSVWLLSRLGELVAHPEKYKGQELYLGAEAPVQLDQSWIDRLDHARNEIASGRNYREVMTELQTGIMAQLGDMAGQAVADPLNALPRVESKVGEVIATANDNKVAAESFRTSTGLVDAAQKYKTLVQTGQALTIDPTFQVDQMSWLSRLVAGVNKQGEIRTGSLVPTETGLLDPIKNKTGFLDEMATQTPHSRAQTGAGMFYENIGTLLTLFDDPHEAGKYISAIAKGDNEVWSQLGSRFANSPEFYTILPALKAFATEKLDGIVGSWDLVATNRDMLTRLADVLGEEPARLLDDLAKRGTSEQDYARIVERLRTSNSPEAKTWIADIEAGKFTVETLKQTVDIFTGEGALPWHPGQWKALMLDTLGDHFDQWVTQRLMLDKSPEAVSAFFRTTALMKQAQSILLLGGSPGYAITNGLSNMVHRAATGIYGYLSPTQINSFMDRMGVTPARLEEGVGIGGQVETKVGSSKVKTEAINDAIRGKGPLTTAKDRLKKLSSGMPFSKLSSWFEMTERKQAITIAMKQFWSASWRRGVGFSTMAPELVRAITDMGINPERIYAAIEAGMNQAEIEKALFGRFEGVQARSLVNDAAQKTGVTAANAARLLDQIGVLDALDAQLKGKTTPDGVRAAFARVNKQAQDWIDMQTGEDLKAKAESVRQRVGLEGATAALDVAQQATATFVDTWMDHYSRFGEVMNDLSLLDNPDMRNRAIEFNYEISDAEFRGVYARHASSYQGIFEAWGMSGNPDALNVLAAIGESDVALRDAYRGMREIRKGYFEKYRNDYDNPAKWDEWDADSHKIDSLFKKGFNEKHQAEVKMGASLGKIYESLYGPAAGEAARQWWEDVVQFNEEMVKREQDFRGEIAQARRSGVPKELIEARKQEYYSKTKIGMIAEVERINGEGIARLERVIKGGSSDAGQGNPAPTGPIAPEDSLRALVKPYDAPPTPPAPATPEELDARLVAATPPSPREIARTNEINELLAAAEQRRTTEAAEAADRLSAVWDVAEGYWGSGANYSRGVLQDKFALMGALRKPEYGGMEELTGLNDPRLTPDLVQRVLDARQLAKAAESVQQVGQGIVNAAEAASNVQAPKIDDNTTILKAIAEHGGINKLAAKDLTGEQRPKSAPGVFTNKGVGIDEMARMLADDGYPINLEDPGDMGGVMQTTALLNRARTGDKIYPVGHDHEAMIARAQNDAAMQAFTDTVQDQPFDAGLWQSDFAETVARADLTRMYDLIGSFPEELTNTLTPDGETYRDFMSRVADETAAKVEAEALDQVVAEHASRVQAAIAESQTRADAVTTRQLLKEKFQEVFGLNEDQAQAYMELSDAVAGWYAKATGESADGFYARYYADVVGGDVQKAKGAEGQRLEQEANRIWYSKLTQTVEGITQPKMTVDQLRGAITKAGVKADELKWMGFDDFLKGKKNITKEEALNFLRENQVQIKELTKGGWNELVEEGNPQTKYEQYVLPGAENYREVLFTLPEKKLPEGTYFNMEDGQWVAYLADGTEIGRGRNAVEVRVNARQHARSAKYKSQHWDEPNVLAHVRLDDRIDADGKRVLFVEEVQSDWHQAGREKGYKDTIYTIAYLQDGAIKTADFKTYAEAEKFLPTVEASTAGIRTINSGSIANAPFSKTWHEMVMKRVLRMAAEDGYDRVAWTTGEQQAARYDLRKQVDGLDWNEATGELTGTKAADGRHLEVFSQKGVTRDNLVDYVGKDAARSFLETTPEPDGWRNIEGESLAVGGEGMKGFYDTILPAFMDKYAKKWNAKTGETSIKSPRVTYKEGFKVGSESPTQWYVYKDGEKYDGPFRTESDAIKYAPQVSDFDKVHSIDVTPTMRESVMGGQPLFQTAKGAVTFDAEGIKATIHAFEAADFSTLVHENAHVFRRMLADVAERTNNAQIRADLVTIEEWAGVKDGQWNRAAEEKFARGFERYVTEGKAPNLKLARAFEVFRQWMLEIYKTITGSAIDVKLTDDVRAAFDRMLGGGERKADFDPNTEWVDTDGTIRPKQIMTFDVDDEASRANAQELKESASFQELRARVAEMRRARETPPQPPSNNDMLFQTDQPFGAYDEASQFYPESEVKDAAWRQSIRPLMDAMEELAVQQLREKPLDGATRDMSPEGQAMLLKYMRQTQGEMATTKLATIRHGETKADFAMLNYSKRYGFDRMAETVYPYELYQTRTLFNWGLRALDKPAFFSNYARLHNQMNRYERDIPERLRNKIKIPAPWLPEWAGDSLYIDPLGSLFPPANLLRPFERMMQDTNYQQIEAERVLQEWAADGQYSQTEIQQAAQSRSGTLYERAFAEAQIRRESDVNNPLDFMNTMLGPAWYLTTPYKLAMGETDQVNSTPLYNTVRGIDTVTRGTWAEPIGNMIGLLGKPEEWARKKLNLPEFGEYGDYYVDRQLANMVAEGSITSEDAQLAMIERQGELFDQARERVKMELALRVPTMGALYATLQHGPVAGAQAFLPSLFGAGLLPAGELEYRGLKQEWNQAWDQVDKGNKGAINRFFDLHPEYEAYLAKGKPPEERLKSFLIGQIWDGYMGLGPTDQRQARAEMGESFAQSFLNKETRSYDTLDVDQLTAWAQMLNMKVPAPPPIPSPSLRDGEGSQTVPKLDLLDPEITKTTDQFFRERTERFPNYYTLQTQYYAQPTNADKSKFLLENPEYGDYVKWRNRWYQLYPEYKPIFNGDAFDRVDTSTWPPMLEDFVQLYAMTGQRLPNGAYKSLQQVWIREGQPMDSFETWLNSTVVPSMLYGNQQGVMQ